MEAWMATAIIFLGGRKKRHNDHGACNLFYPSGFFQYIQRPAQLQHPEKANITLLALIIASNCKSAY